MGHAIELKSNDGFAFDAYVAQPKNAPRAAIVVLQEIFGVNAHIRAVADGFALAGFLVIAPATFSRVQKNVNLGYSAEEVATGRELKGRAEALPAPGVMAEVQAAITHASLACKGKVGVMGYCWGGLLTWRAATQLSGVKAAVAYYGGGMTLPPELNAKPLCPVLAHFGAHDPLIPLDTVEAFRLAQPEVDVQVYDADHGFNCDHRSSYNAAAAELALENTLGFFIEHFQL